MTREEAAKQLSEWKEVITIPSRKEAINMAIKALEQPDLTADQIHTMKEQEYMRGYEDGRKVERESWDEMLAMCDNCGHAIHVKREDVRKQKPSEVGAQMSLPDDDELSKAIQNLEEIADEEDNIAYNLEPEQWMNIASCEKRAAYNRQLASWLLELKKRRQQGGI